MTKKNIEIRAKLEKIKEKERVINSRVIS